MDPAVGKDEEMWLHGRVKFNHTSAAEAGRRQRHEEAHGVLFIFLRKLGSRRISGPYHRGSVQVLQSVPSETTIVLRSHMLHQLCSRAEWKVQGDGA